ncbi:MAG: squalene--hopene cyclase [Deltaproteobacteria bacterium]|nr:squalene--hopene cyclase [Deltaproteobacteria bacterium]MBW1951917.1 squalene--hopene cyclase [Deltaproteobacteria bacterium]MBW1986335.1 squalene--hopene cyclase [Deltaproteobacteria bacterium]MBW2134377.1 squalene--hopene cyclase [Deltaproteobacteria bacterium]
MSQQRTWFLANESLTEAVEKAVAGARQALLGMQTRDGYWWAELESNVTITAEYLMLHYLLEIAEPAKISALANYILQQQLDNGGWSIYYGDGGDLSTSVEAYLALKLAGLSPQEPAVQRARAFIQQRGGPLRTRVFTRIFLALFGQVSWEGVPTLPVEFILFPPQSGLSIYEFSSWSRATIVPLSVVMAKQPVLSLPLELGVRELFSDAEEGFRNHRVQWNHNGLSLDNLFVLWDRVLKFYQSWPLHLFRRLALKRAEDWILEHQEDSGDWGGIQPAMLNSLLALHCLGYANDHPAMRRGLEALEFFTLKDQDSIRLQSCISPVWDTALAVRALAASGCPVSHSAMIRACDWLLRQQILVPGDWSIKKPDLAPGGWAFEFVNNWYPDIDDSAVVLMALKEGLPDPDQFRSALNRGIDWCLGMQSKNGGFGAFDVDNTKDWLNSIPFGDLKALIDPPTEDVTGRVLEMMGIFGFTLDHPVAARAYIFLRRTQQPDGCWWGRWGVNYIYGTWSVLLGLKSIGEDMSQTYIRQAVAWLKGCQNADGGWGETCESYRRPQLRGQGESTASQTAWALMALIAAGEAHSPEVRKGAEYLVRTQNTEGRWEEAYFTGTGFPQHFMIRYHLYRDCFPLMALGQYLQACGRTPHE